MKKRPSVYDMLAYKGKRQLIELHIEDEREGAAAEAAGIDMFSCEVNDELEKIRVAAPTAFIQAAIPGGTVHSAADGIRIGFDLLNRGADAVYCTAGLGIVEAMAREGIPVTGHVGLVPNHVRWTNFRAIGKTPEEAVQIFKKIRSLESAGAWAVEVEVVPAVLATYLSRNTTLLTEGMGSGSGCDTQYLFSCDVLGTNTGRYPRHAKRYADLATEYERLQQMRIEAFRAYADDVRTGHYPEPGHGVSIDEATFARTIEAIERA